MFGEGEYLPRYLCTSRMVKIDFRTIKISRHEFLKIYTLHAKTENTGNLPMNFHMLENKKYGY